MCIQNYKVSAKKDYSEFAIWSALCSVKDLRNQVFFLFSLFYIISYFYLFVNFCGVSRHWFTLYYLMIFPIQLFAFPSINTLKINIKKSHASFKSMAYKITRFSNVHDI